MARITLARTGTGLGIGAYNARCQRRLRQIASAVLPNTKFVSYEYDLAHNTTKVTDPAGNVIVEISEEWETGRRYLPRDDD